jgi:phytanoyl-CoA hydroxylase
MGLSAHQRRAFERDGVLVVEGFAPAAACRALIERSHELLEAFEPESISVFTTHEQTRTSDDYFLESGDKVRFFFEEDAFADDGSLKQAKELSINKIGHALHDLDPLFDDFSRTPELAEVASDVGFRDPRLLQSMYIFKQPSIGGEVTCHQDSTFLYTNPLSCIGFWFALEDATLENGCLWAEPGGHRGPLRKRFRRAAEGGTTFDTLDDAPLPEPGDGRLVPLETPAGTLVLLHGQLPHYSGPNRSPKSRHAYSVHLIEGSAAYPDDNWLQRGEGMPLRGFREVAGTLGS